MENEIKTITTILQLNDKSCKYLVIFLLARGWASGHNEPITFIVFSVSLFVRQYLTMELICHKSIYHKAIKDSIVVVVFK